jgi:hypothetical protein
MPSPRMRGKCIDAHRPMTLNPDSEAMLLKVIRLVPPHLSDDAWAYAAGRLRLCGDEPSVFDVKDICGAIRQIFVGRRSIA